MRGSCKNSGFLGDNAVRAFLGQILLLLLGLIIEIGVPIFFKDEHQKLFVKVLGVLFICLAIFWFGLEFLVPNPTDFTAVDISTSPADPLPSIVSTSITTEIDLSPEATLVVLDTPLPTETIDSHIYESVQGLTFVSGVEDVKDIYRIDQFGVPPKRLTTLERDLGWPSWSYDGQEIAFVTVENGSYRIALADSQGMNFRVILTDIAGVDFIHPTWSPDKRTIAFGVLFPGKSTYDLYYKHFDSSGGIGIKRPDDNESMLGPAWSPNGAYIAFYSVNRDGTEADLYLYDFNTNSLTQLTNDPGLELDPAWSPDGSEIVFSSDGDIWVIRADGTQARAITNDEGNQREPAWSPDGKFIAYQIEVHNDIDIYVIPLDGSLPPMNVNVQTPSGMYPSWQPRQP